MSIPNEKKAENIRWFTNARFGMFIHVKLELDGPAEPQFYY